MTRHAATITPGQVAALSERASPFTPSRMSTQFLANLHGKRERSAEVMAEDSGDSEGFLSSRPTKSYKTNSTSLIVERPREMMKVPMPALSDGGRLLASRGVNSLLESSSTRSRHVAAMELSSGRTVDVQAKLKVDAATDFLKSTTEVPLMEHVSRASRPEPSISGVTNEPKEVRALDPRSGPSTQTDDKSVSQASTAYFTCSNSSTFSSVDSVIVGTQAAQNANNRVMTPSLSAMQQPFALSSHRLTSFPAPREASTKFAAYDGSSSKAQPFSPRDEDAKYSAMDPDVATEQADSADQPASLLPSIAARARGSDLLFGGQNIQSLTQLLTSPVSTSGHNSLSGSSLGPSQERTSRLSPLLGQVQSEAHQVAALSASLLEEGNTNLAPSNLMRPEAGTVCGPRISGPGASQELTLTSSVGKSAAGAAASAMSLQEQMVPFTLKVNTMSRSDANQAILDYHPRSRNGTGSSASHHQLSNGSSPAAQSCPGEAAGADGSPARAEQASISGGTERELNHVPDAETGGGSPDQEPAFILSSGRRWGRDKAKFENDDSLEVLVMAGSRVRKIQEFVLSSGRQLSHSPETDAEGPTTIDGEFEDYFAKLLL